MPFSVQSCWRIAFRAPDGKRTLLSLELAFEFLDGECVVIFLGSVDDSFGEFQLLPVCLGQFDGAVICLSIVEPLSIADLELGVELAKAAGSNNTVVGDGLVATVPDSHFGDIEAVWSALGVARGVVKEEADVVVRVQDRKHVHYVLHLDDDVVVVPVALLPFGVTVRELPDEGIALEIILFGLAQYLLGGVLVGVLLAPPVLIHHLELFIVEIWKTKSKCSALESRHHQSLALRLGEEDLGTIVHLPGHG